MPYRREQVGCAGHEDDVEDRRRGITQTEPSVIDSQQGIDTVGRAVAALDLVMLTLILTVTAVSRTLLIVSAFVDIDR